jgi:hypothetical protein
MFFSVNMLLSMVNITSSQTVNQLPEGHPINSTNLLIYKYNIYIYVMPYNVNVG